MPVVESNLDFVVEALQPASPPLVLTYRGDDNVANVATQINEVDLTKQLDRESFIRLYPALPYYELDRAATVVDTLYRETSAPIFKDEVRIPIFIQVQPPKKLLKRFGLENEHEAIGLFSNGWLEKYQPSLTIKPGDRIGYYDQPFTGSYPTSNGTPDVVVSHEVTPPGFDFSFEVLTIKHCDYFGNTQVPIHRIVSLKNLRAPGKPDTKVKPQ